MRSLFVYRLLLISAVALLLAACSSAPDLHQSNQQAPGTVTRPILSSREALAFTEATYFAATAPGMSDWTPHKINLPARADFVVGPSDTPDVQFTAIQDAVNAAITKHGTGRLYIEILPGHYSGTVFIPQASNQLTLYGTGQSPEDTVISLSLDGDTDAKSWQQVVNPHGQYQPGDPAWYMYQSCAQRQPAGRLCSATVWSQNDGLQLQNLTIENVPDNTMDAGDHPAVALRTDGDQVQLDYVNILGLQNTLLVTNSDIDNRWLIDAPQPRVLITNSYLEGDVDMVAGRGTIVFGHSTLRLVDSRTQHLTLFAPATLADQPYGFLAINSRFIAPAGSMAQLGRNWDLAQEDSTSAVNGQVVIRDSEINDGFNAAMPWGDALVSDAPFLGNIGSKQDDSFIRNTDDTRFNRMWEYNTDSDVLAEPVEAK